MIILDKQLDKVFNNPQREGAFIGENLVLYDQSLSMRTAKWPP